jgi:hypothetical protein
MEVRRKGYRWELDRRKVATSTLDNLGLLMEVARQHTPYPSLLSFRAIPRTMFSRGTSSM